jgi:hypothetical protein
LNTAANAPPVPKFVEPVQEDDDEGVPELRAMMGDKIKMAQ